jgi:hypothetical protein
VVAQRCRGGDGKRCSGVEVVVLGVFGRRENGDGGGECTARGRWGKEGVNSDLKIGHVRVQLECDRLYVGVFDRIRAKGVCENGLCVRTYRVCSNACVQECVCVMGRCGRTNASEFECSSVSTFERKGCVRT